MDLKNLISQEDLIAKRNTIKKVFFYRICGAGMGPCAVLIKQAGFDVEGADSAFYPPMSTYLESTKIPLHSLDKVDEKFLQQFDLIVVGNSVSGKIEAARMVERSGVPFTSFPSALGSLVLKDKNVVGIAGTHGKTTTTYFMTQLLEKLNQNPGYLIGGIIEGRAPSKLGDKYFVIESDEYDSAYFHKISKFRFYEMDHMILTSLEFDHADIFANVEQIEDQFKAVIPSLTKTIVFNSEYPSANKIFNEFKDHKGLRWIKYQEDTNSGPFNIQVTDMGSSFEVEWNGKRIPFETTAVGAHNVLNISACILFLLEEEFKVGDIQAAVKELSMVKRRQELRGSYNGMLVIDDFAHHPRAINVTIDAIRARYKNKKIITIFEPISATARSSIFQTEFRESLKKSDKVFIAQSTIATTAINSKDLDTVKMAQELTDSGIPAHSVTKLEDLRHLIDQNASQDALLLVLSNRTCLGLWESDFVQALKV